MSDGQILELIDGLLVDSETGRCLSLREKDGLRDELFCSVRRLDVLQELIDDPQVTEIMVNGCHNIFVERDGRITRFEKTLPHRKKLEDVIQQIVGNVTGLSTKADRLWMQDLIMGQELMRLWNLYLWTGLRLPYGGFRMYRLRWRH